MKLKERQLLDASTSGRSSVIKSLIASNIDVNVRDPHGMPNNRTALMHAAENGHLEIVEQLLKAGAEVDAKDKGIPLDFPGGNTALILALKNKHVKVAERLLEAGASVIIKGGGTTVVCAASELGNVTLLREILREGGDPNSRTALVGPALGCALFAGSLNACRSLLEAGADPNALDAGRIPLLAGAASDGIAGGCELLLEKGAEVDLASRDDRMTALMFAVRGGHSQILELLLKRGASVNLLNVRNETALDIAISDKEKNCERLLRKVGAKRASELRR